MLATGVKKNYYIEDATDNAATNLKFDSTTEQKYTVPSGKRWYLIGGVVNRDVSKTLTITACDTSDKIIHSVAFASAGTGKHNYPTGVAGTANLHRPIILDAGEYIHIVFGDAQGAGAYASCVVIEVTL